MKSPAPLRIIFAGTPEFSTHALHALWLSPHSVCAVYTQPDRPAGRGRKLTASPIKQLAVKYAIPVRQPIGLKHTDAIEELRAWQADLMVVVAYGLILPRPVLNIPYLGCINIHASLLPRWRGAAPIQRAILAGDSATGITIMQMDAGLDTGKIISQHACPVLPTDTAHDLHDRLAGLSTKALMDALDDLQNGSALFTPQDETQACYAAKIEKREAELDWHQDAVTLARKVRAFNPWPVAQTRLSSGQTLRIWSAHALAGSDDPAAMPNSLPGKVIGTSAAGIDVATGGGILRLTQLQLPGGRPLAVSDFVNAHTLDNQTFQLGATA
ncbi:MAG: methionyl-tRNA formyltransferase [Gammaproteobacteria bacterium]